MRIAVIADLHANLPALRAALAAIRREGYDELVHLGDAIGIGPYPAESLDLLLSIDRASFVMGNHDALFVDGIPEKPDMSDGEAAHGRWTHAMLRDDHRRALAGWPFAIEREIGGTAVTFIHYALDGDRRFAPIIASPSAADLDRLFARHGSSLILHGHHHPFLDLAGERRHINPGSLGCCERPIARWSIIEFGDGCYTVGHRSVIYDDAELLREFERRDVPEREFIRRAFFGGR